jgi:hypothetical protein
MACAVVQPAAYQAQPGSLDTGAGQDAVLPAWLQTERSCSAARNAWQVTLLCVTYAAHVTAERSHLLPEGQQCAEGPVRCCQQLLHLVQHKHPAGLVCRACRCSTVNQATGDEAATAAVAAARSGQ